MNRDPDHLIGGIGLAILMVGLLWRFFDWFRKPATSADPWGEEIEKAVHEPEAVEVCHRCLDPVPPNAWFCEHCGCSVGPYNNWMPYLSVFSQGEVLRNGVDDKLPRNALIVAGYLFFSILMYSFFAPIYWIFLFRNLKQPKDSIEQTAPPRV